MRRPRTREDRARIDGGARLYLRTNEKLALAHPPRVVAPAGNGSVNYVADWVMDIIDDCSGTSMRTSLCARRSIWMLQVIAEDALDEELSSKGAKLGSAKARWSR